MTGSLDLFVWHTQGEEGQCGSLVALIQGSDAKVEHTIRAEGHEAERMMLLGIPKKLEPYLKLSTRELKGKGGKKKLDKLK